MVIHSILLQQTQVKLEQLITQKINMTSLKGMISTYVTIFMNQSGLKSEIEVVKILFVVISTNTQMTIFRHQFLDYLESCLSKLSNENKEVYLCGDFNSDLLKLDKVNNYKRFYELMCSYGFLPQILQSTRIQGDSATIVDNIFTNTCNSEIHSGNIITELSDHFTQIVSVSREKLELQCIGETTHPSLKIVLEMMYLFKILITILKMSMINL